MIEILRSLISGVGNAGRAAYWNLMDTIAALNPLRPLGSLYGELRDLFEGVGRGLKAALRAVAAIPQFVGWWIWRTARFLLLLPLELLALIGIGPSRLGIRSQIDRNLSAVTSSIEEIRGTVSELNPVEVGARIGAETRDVGYAVAAGIRGAIRAILWAPFGFLLFLYDLARGIGSLPGRLKSAIVNRTKKQLAFAAAFMAISGGCLYLVYDLWATRGSRNARIVKLWQEYSTQIRSIKPEKAIAALDELLELQPNDPMVQRKKRQLQSGKPDPDDLELIRLFMRKELAENKLPKSAELAAMICSAEPADWEANLVLAHQSLTQKETDKSREFVSRMQPPDRVAQGIGPGALVYATRIFREINAKEQLDLAIDYFIYRVLPIVNNYEAEKWPLVQKLQMIEAYLISLERLDSSPGLASFWVPVQRLCRWAFEDPSLDLDAMVRLAMAEEAQFSALQAFLARKLIEESEFESLRTEVESRLQRIWDEVVKRDPKNVRAYTAKALARYRANDLKGAIESLDLGISQCGPAIELVAAKSQLLRNADPSAGYEFAKDVQRSDPKSMPLLAVLADASVRAGRLDEAVTACQLAIALQSDLHWANRLLGQLCLQLNRPTEAVVAFRRILSSVQEDEKAAAEYVRALCQLGMFDDVDAFTMGLPMDSDPRANVIAAVCEALIRSNRSDLAEKHVRRLLEVRPSHLPARLIYADYLRIRAEAGAEWDVGLARKAVDEYRTILLREPRNLPVINNVAWLELKALKQPQTALRTAEPMRAVEEGTTLSSEMLETLGAIYMANGELEKARSALSRAIARGTPKASYFLHLSEVYLRLKMISEAEMYFVRARQFPATPMEQRELNELAIRIRGNAK